MITIRPMLPDDIAPVARWVARMPLWQRYQIDELTHRQQFEQALLDADLLLVAANDAGCVVAAAWVMPTGAFGISPYLRRIAVHPDHAGRGIGSTLLAEVERLAAQTSRDLFLFVSDFNTAAQGFYRRQGYQQIGVVPAYVLPDVDELLFYKQLRPT